MTINERIKFFRKELKLTQNEFGERVGLKKSAVSQIENGGTSANPRIIQLICNAFNISEKWLVEGKGEMYVSTEDAIMDKVVQMYDLTPQTEAFVRKWLQFPPEVQESVVDYVVELAESIKAAKENQGTKKDAPDSDASAQGTDCPHVAVFNSPQDTSPKVSPKFLPSLSQVSPNSAPSPVKSDEVRPDGLSDEEWAMVLMLREEKEKGSPTSSATNSELA